MQLVPAHDQDISRGRAYILLLIAFLVALLAFDVLTKLLVQSNFHVGESLLVFGNTVRLTYIQNARGAFGISIGTNLFHIAISIAVVLAIAFALWKDAGKSPAMDFSLAAIISGALGNLIDRIRMGEVVDFIDVDIPDINVLGLHMDRWPVFNVADACVTIGIAAIVIIAVVSKRGESTGSQPAGQLHET